MPTAKKTTTKKPVSKKPVKKIDPVAEASVEEPVEEEVPYEIASEIATEKHMQEGEFVTMIIPEDPSLGVGDQYWEHCVNGVNYRYKRGEELEIPKDLAETFIRKLKMKKISATVFSGWKGEGKKLDM